MRAIQGTTTIRRVLRARVVATGVVLLLAAGGVAASADDLPSSPPELYRASTGSADLAAAGYDGSGVTVAVIDTGAADVPGFDGAVIHQENISSAPAEGDQFGHGTFVNGLVHLTAPGADIVSIKLSDANGAVDVTQVIAALQWVVLNKDRYSIDVVNLSFGNDSRQRPARSPLNYAVQRVWDEGIVVVASAGNEGDAPGTVTKPADDPLIISVGATDETGTVEQGDDTIPTFVSRGPTRDGLTKPDLVAPGTRVVSLRAPGSTVDVANPQARVGEDLFRGSGTSFAAPIVSGLVAQMLSAEPSLTPDEVKAGLLGAAARVDGDPGAMGAGTVRASDALALARATAADQDAIERSEGLGSLDAARGSATVEVETLVREEDGTLAEVHVPVVGEVTAEAAPTASLAPLVDSILSLEPVEALDSWDRESLLLDDEQWEKSTWDASRWGASRWGASRWGASRWGASRWGSSQWWASRWG